MERAFLADAMLGGLARWLRILGLDTYYDPNLDDPEVVERAVTEDRLILTRDAKLVERRDARSGSRMAKWYSPVRPRSGEG